MTSASPIPDFLLEQYLLQELNPEASEVMRHRLEEDADLRERLDFLRASTQDILSVYPASRQRSAIKARIPDRAASGKLRSSETPWAYPFRLPLVGPLAVAGLVLALVWNVKPPTETDARQEIRLKGVEAGLVIYRRHRSQAELLLPQTKVSAGDTLQIFYQSRKEQYGAIFSVDGSGSLTMHLPETKSGAAPLLGKDGLKPLPSAYLLDKAPRFEQFHLITSPKPFAVDSLLIRVESELQARKTITQSPLALGGEFRHYTYTLLKDIPRNAKSKKKTGSPR